MIARTRDNPFGERAFAYARHRPRYPEALAEFLAEIAPRRGLAWDAGCGSGQLSLLLAERFEGVLATDTSEKQIRQAPRHPRVAYRVATAEESGIADHCVDLAVAAQAAHWFDLGAFYAEANRVARRGGAVALVTYGTMSVAPEIDAVIRHFHDELLGPYWASARRHVEDAYGSLPFPFRPIRAPALQMHAEWSLAELMAYLGTWSAVRSAETEGRDPLAELRPRLEGAWGPGDERRLVYWPLTVRAGLV